jgi:GNAT superfamily N-acetyltransferase
MLALLDGTPVGFVSLEFRQPFFTRQPQAWIPDLIVTEAARGRDIGAALLDAAFAEAMGREAYAAALESGHHRSVAHRLYTAAGMADVGSFYTLAR